jgi:hypothetical protein
MSQKGISKTRLCTYGLGCNIIKKKDGKCTFHHPFLKFSCKCYDCDPPPNIASLKGISKPGLCKYGLDCNLLKNGTCTFHHPFLKVKCQCRDCDNSKNQVSVSDRTSMNVCGNCATSGSGLKEYNQKMVKTPKFKNDVNQDRPHVHPQKEYNHKMVKTPKFKNDVNQDCSEEDCFPIHQETITCDGIIIGSDDEDDYSEYIDYDENYNMYS